MQTVRKLIVASTVDEASSNIADKLIRSHGFQWEHQTFQGGKVYTGKLIEDTALVFVDVELAETQDFFEGLKPEVTIFVSRHSSRSGIPTLSVHVPGNLGDAEHGGRPRKVSIAPANAMKNALLELMNQRTRLGLPHLVSYEGTHHGPSIDIPAMFIEIGSTEIEWINPVAGEAVAQATVTALKKRTSFPVALGVGGPHYSPKLTEVGLQGGYALGHVIPKYAVPSLSLDVLRQCVERTVERVETAVIDWKGLRSPERMWIVEALKNQGVKPERV